MGKKQKGKQRRDGFYQKAKLAGYRARSAYKLIQLNTKFKFLHSSRVCIDLCAAPGSWTQVAAKFMPVSSVIIAVDLNPIRPIPNAITIQGDITTDAIVQELKGNLKTWKADLILHDGSPNVGKSWLQDAYDQNVLVLHSFKLACQFLRKGGTFLTKVFRSKDHFSLEFVFRKLFSKVEATKPIASRYSSAEIYVICQGFLAPDKIDPHFFDPKHVFLSLEAEPTNKINIFKPVSKKQKAEGYEEGVVMLYKPYKISEFIFSSQHIDVLESANEFTWDLPRARESIHTTQEIVELFKDIKVLNRKDLRALLNWRKVIKDELGPLEETTELKTKNLEVKPPVEVPPEKEEEELDELDEELKEIEKVQQQVEELKASSAREEKQRAKKIEKRKKKIADKNSLRLMVPGDPGPQEMDKTGLFRLDTLNSAANIDSVIDQSAEMVLPSDSDEEEGDVKKKKLPYSKRGAYNEETGVYEKPLYEESDGMDSSDESSEDDVVQGLNINEEKEKKKFKSVTFSEDTVDNEDLGEGGNPLLTDLVGDSPISRDERRAEKWFSKPVFDSLEKDEVEDYELDKAIEDFNTKGLQLFTRPCKSVSSPPDRLSKKRAEIPKEDFSIMDAPSQEKRDSGLDTGSDSDSDSDSSHHDDVPQVNDGKGEKKRKLDEVGLALATKMIRSKKAKREIYDDSWNRYMYGDEKLPDWFEKDEKKHNSPRIEVDTDDLKMYQESNKAVNVRSLKKVVEAKGRKQRRIKKAMGRTQKKAENIANSADMTQREKAVELKKMYKKVSSQMKKKNKTYIVMKKHFAGKKPKGVKGPSKMVDKRLKKDKRSQQTQRDRKTPKSKRKK